MRKSVGKKLECTSDDGIEINCYEIEESNYEGYDSAYDLDHSSFNNRYISSEEHTKKSCQVNNTNEEKLDFSSECSCINKFDFLF